jgi:hypothetical protein
MDWRQDNFVKRRRVGGFTFVELMLGLVVTALVTAALSVLLAAVAQGWKQGESTQSASTLTAQAHLRLQRYLKAAALVGAVREGSIDNSSAKSAAMLIWKNDDNRDWKIQFSEVALLEYSPAGATKDQNTIRYYRAKTSGLTAQEQADAATALPSNNDLYTDANIEDFKKCSYVTYTVVAKNVLGCVFHKTDAYTAARPEVDYILRLSGASGTETDLGTVALRTPATMPVEQR